MSLVDSLSDGICRLPRLTGEISGEKNSPNEFQMDGLLQHEPQ